MPDDLEYTADDVAQAEARLPPRVVAQLRELGREHSPPIGWEARVLSSAVPPRSTWLRDIAWAIVAGVVIGALVSIAIAWLGGWL